MKRIILICLIILNSLTSFSQTKWKETIRFKNFKVDIVNFKPECSPCIENTNPLDTFSIAENPCDEDGWYINGRTLIVIPKFKNDSFALSYAYEVNLYEVAKKHIEMGEHFNYITKYLSIPTYNNNRFKIPEWRDNGYNKAIRKKYNFRDTLITGSSESGPFEDKFTKNGKVYRDRWNALFIRIKRYNNNVLKETKYIRVGLSEGCD